MRAYVAPSRFILRSAALDCKLNIEGCGYAYDPAGNRLLEQVDDTVRAWTHDRLNRLITQQVGGMLTIAGAVDETAGVRVDGRPASVDTAGSFVGGAQVAALARRGSP